MARWDPGQVKTLPVIKKLTQDSADVIAIKEETTT